MIKSGEAGYSFAVALIQEVVLDAMLVRTVKALIAACQSRDTSSSVGSGCAGFRKCMLLGCVARYDPLACRYALHVPDNLPLDAAAPLLCAGITVYSPMMHYGLNKPGMKLGVVGLGGLGHMAVKFGKVCSGNACKAEAKGP